MLSIHRLFDNADNIRFKDVQAIAEFGSNGRSEANLEQTRNERTHLEYSFKMERPEPNKFICVLQ